MVTTRFKFGPRTVPQRGNSGPGDIGIRRACNSITADSKLGGRVGTRD
jgi:hypothetical protein